MNTFFKIMLLSSAVTFTSCSTEDKVTADSKGQFDLNIVPDLSQLKMGEPDVFFTYNDSKDAGVNLIKAIDELQLEVNDAMLDNPKITAHQFAITMSSGKAIIESLYFYDEKNEVLIANPIKSKGNSSSSILPEFISAVLPGNYPSGWTKIGTYGLTAQSQFESDVKAELTNALSSSGGCIELHISRGLLSGTACKRPCP